MSEITVVPKKGPPAKYDPTMCDIIVDIAAQGGHIAAMMVAIDCRSKETWYRWKDEHPEFAEAIKYAELVSQVYWEKVGQEGLFSKNFNATSYALIMNNKFGDDYKRTGASGSNTEITINQVNLSPEQIEQKIAQKLSKLKSLGITFNNESEIINAE